MITCHFGAFSLARASLARASLTWPTLARFHFGAFHFDAFSSHTILFSLISLYSCPIWERVRYMRKLRLCTKLRYCLPRRHFMICGTCTTTTSTSTHIESISWAASFYLCCITMNTYQCAVSCILYYTITATLLAAGRQRATRLASSAIVSVELSSTELSRSDPATAGRPAPLGKHCRVC